MKKKSIFLLALTVALVLSCSINSAISYFTTYAKARGGYTIELGDTHIDEEISQRAKHVTISADEKALPSYVRARGYSGAAYPLEYTFDAEDWTDGGDGWYYYNHILEPGASTNSPLHVQLTFPAGEDLEAGDSFNVYVLYESTPVTYDEDGNPLPADWALSLEGGN